MKLKQILKKKLMLAILKSSNRKNPFNIDKADNFQLLDSAGENMTDSHYFSAHNQSGESFFFRYAKRSNDTIEVWFCLKNSDGAIYVNNQELFQSKHCPASVKCITPGQSINLTFTGNVALTQKGENDVLSLDKTSIPVKCEAHFQASMPPFDFTTGLDPTYIAEALSKERWTKTFWNNLRTNRQVHYEQAGVIELTIEMNNQKQVIVFSAMRDHSFGYRDWNYMNRHIWLMVIFEDGEILNLNMVDYPHMRNLMTGYQSVNGIHTSLKANSNLKELGKDGHVPETVIAPLTINQQEVELCGQREFAIDFSFEQGKYHIFEGVGTYTMNNRRGRGILEFGFNSDISRWK